MINRANDILRWYMPVIDFNTFNYVKLCLKMISNELRFHVIMRMMWKTWNVENCISVWKHEHVWCKSWKHKHIHGTKCWTKDSWVAYLWAPCNKTIGLRIPWHYETKGLWAAYPLGTMKQKIVGLRIPRHQNETKTDDEHA
jgi:hypothetical protein